MVSVINYSFSSILLIIVISLLFSNLFALNDAKNQVNSTSNCAPDSFICPGQGNCIPADWVGDGEPDCEDGADERRVAAPFESANANNGSGIMEVDPFATATLTPANSLDEWIQQIVQQMPDFFDRPLQSGRLILQGCPFLLNPDNNNATPWPRLQMFLCELLGPALRDQPDCLSASKHCPMPKIGQNISMPCALSAQSSAHFRCLESAPPVECDDSALEMLGPLQQESEHWALELECPSANSPTNNIASSAETEMTMEGRPQTDEPIEEEEDGEEGKTTAALESTIPTETGSSTLMEEWPPSSWDALSMFNGAESVCQNQKGNEEDELAAPILAKICDRLDVFTGNEGRKCFEELAKREHKKCHQKPIHANSTCDILEAFSQNLDCALHTLNEICPIEMQEAVIGIQEQLNDEAIARQCYQQKEANNNNNDRPSNGQKQQQFPFRPEHSPCLADQEETAMLCLAELADLPARLQRLPSLGALLSNQSTLLQPVCALFDRYDACIQSRVFGGGPQKGDMKKCALNSPLNGLARVGLAPICAHSRAILAGKFPSDCLLQSASSISQCQAPVDALGRAVGAILQGGTNGPAQLCKAFYSLRDAFKCGQQAIGEEQQCAGQLDELLAMLNSIGREEGCPEKMPANFDSFLLPPPPPPHLAPSSSIPSRPPSIPQARPLSPPSTVNIPQQQCPPSLQQQFQQCVQPLSKFQPHPLSVIKQPRLIADACTAFANFTECQAQLPPKCVPLWSKGMGGMFEFACGAGNQQFLDIRQCLRRVTKQPELGECVLTFSRASPQEACPSSGQLLSCALPQIEQKCGQKAGQFVREYVGRFAGAMEPTCSIVASQIVVPSHVVDLPSPPSLSTAISLSQNCSQEQSKIVQQCAIPIDNLRAQLDAMFMNGGVQTLLKNLNGLANLFQQGCSISAQFQTCIGPILKSDCTISSCLLASGSGICDQPDVGAAIDANMGCVFRQVSNPDFGQCIRTHLGPLRQLNLTALRAALPQFVECIQPIVLRECGPIPLNVLRVLASKSQADCPLGSQQPPPPSIQQASPICTQQLRQNRLNCQQTFLLSKYEFAPIVLLNLSTTNQTTNELEQFCLDLEKMQKCELETRPCEAEEPYGKARAMRALGPKLCSSKVEFARQFECLKAATESEEGQPCVEHKLAGEDEHFCEAVNASNQCLASQIFAECGPDALEFVFAATNEYLAQIVPGAKCQLEAPSLALQTGCTEPQLVAYLECEAAMDRFRPRPIAIIGNQSRWDEYCAVASGQFRPCVEKLECRPEPAAGAALFMAEAVCQREISARDQRQFGHCLLAVTEKAEGRQCLDQFRGVDLLGKEAGPKVCAGIDQLLQCVAKMIHSDCGEDALLHIFELYNGWANAFQPGSSLSPPDFGQFATNGIMKLSKTPEVEFSADQKPILATNGSSLDGVEEEMVETDGKGKDKKIDNTTMKTMTMENSNQSITTTTISITAATNGSSTLGTPKRIGNGAASGGEIQMEMATFLLMVAACFLLF